MNEHVAEVSTRDEIWRAQPVDARLVGIVVARDGMPSIVEQRRQLTNFGVPIEGFRHPAPNVAESWEERLDRVFGRLVHGDIVVVTSARVFGRDAVEETETIAELGRRGIMIKVLAHAEPADGSKKTS